MKYRSLEKITKGVANHRRIQILELLSKYPDLSVLEITQQLHLNYKTASEHIRRLYLSTLITKKNFGNKVVHQPTPLGKSILKFLRTLE